MIRLSTPVLHAGGVLVDVVVSVILRVSRKALEGLLVVAFVALASVIARDRPAPEPLHTPAEPTRATRRRAHVTVGVLLVFVLAAAVAGLVYAATAPELSVFLVGIGAGTIVLIVVGLILWLPHRSVASSRSELGATILGGAAISLAVLVLQVGMQLREERLQRATAAAEARQNIQSDLQQRSDLVGINLAGRDLQRLFLQGRDLSNADLSRALSRPGSRGDSLSWFPCS
jgi:hypothetical protein